MSSVTIVSLANNPIDGTLPTTVGRATDLKRLCVLCFRFSNSLIGNGPTICRILTSLRLSGSLPTEIGRMTDLTLLFVPNWMRLRLSLSHTLLIVI